MAAVTRWVRYDVDAVGEISGGGTDCRGNRGYAIGTNDPGDAITISSSANRLWLSIGGETAPYITLYSGTNLDPRFIARDITEKLHDITGKTTTKWIHSICRWENTYADPNITSYNDYGNRFKIYSGELGSSSSVTMNTGANSVNSTLGFGAKDEDGGVAGSSLATYNGTISVSGTYYGFLDDVYKIVLTNDNDATRGIGIPTEDPSNNYDGTMTTGGLFNGPTDITYVIAVNVTGGATMGAGTGNVPYITWTSTGSDDSTTNIELLYPDHWYSIGGYGLKVKFSDAVFNTCNPAWSINCYKPDYVQGTNADAAKGTAKFSWTSERGDDATTTYTTNSGTDWVRLGTKGIEIKFVDHATPNNLYAGDEFYVVCGAPKPAAYNISSLNYGNVTVSTESDVKSVLFEVESGAVEVSTVKFGLQSHGTFSHHKQNDNDTKFRFATVGSKNMSGPAPTTGVEWLPNCTAADIDESLSPYMYSGNANLSVVSDADNSEDVGSYGLTADSVWVNIKLGASETGANSTINHRLYFDYS